MSIMRSRKPAEGPFPYPTQSTWPEDLYEAIVNTCRAEGLEPSAHRAVIDALAPALGKGEAKRVVERRGGVRTLKATAYHVEGRGTDHALLLLNVDLHGAATLPWPLNDRTRSDWMHPRPDTLALLQERVDQERVVRRCEAGLSRAKAAQRGLATTSSTAEKDAAVAAVKVAEDQAAQAKMELSRRQLALGGRLPLPVVHCAVEDGVPTAALATMQASSDVAAAIQSYAVERLRERGRLRTYDLVESLVHEGQREATVVVLQQTPMVDDDGTAFEAWRPFQVTGNNRADCRLQIFELKAEDLLTGVPQPLLKRTGEAENTRFVLRGLGEILSRVSERLNEEYADPYRDTDGIAERALRISQVPARVVVGAATPERLEAALRELNRHDHLRGQLVYDDEARSLGLWSTVVGAYQAKGLLGDLLAQEVAHGRITGAEIDESAVVDALVGAGPLDPLVVLLSPGEDVTPLTLRDIAIRCTTALLFPSVPPRPSDLAPRAHMPTGRYWPVVRAALQEAPWSQDNTAKAKRRTEVWAAVVAQHFMHRGNLLSMSSAFGASEVQFGAKPDPRSLTSLLTACREGDSKAWEILVRRHLLPGLVNAPEPLITSGQGSERGEDRKGVRRTPFNAVHALVEAYTTPPSGVSRALLMAFAEAVLQAPDSTQADDDLAPGTFRAPDESGGVSNALADKTWYDKTFPKTSNSRGSSGPGRDEEESPIDEPRETSRDIAEDFEEPALTRMTRLRAEISGQVERSHVVVQNAIDELTGLVETITEAVAARQEAGRPEEPAELQKVHVRRLADIRTVSEGLAPLLNAATLAVMKL